MHDPHTDRKPSLDSRQRKKQHTERLEDEKKHFNMVLGNMEEEMNELKDKMEQLMHENESYEKWVSTLRLEKDEMIRTHTIETGELRKKVGVLTEHIHRIESGAIPAAAPNANNAFSGAYNEMEMDDMAMGGNWDNSNFLDEYPSEPELKPEMPVVPAKKNDTLFAADGDKSQGGLLFMLFLVGAFVMSSRSTPAIPRVSEDVRVASATLLDNVLKDAGIQSQSNAMRPIAPQPSGTAWAGSAPGMPTTDMSMGSVAPSMLSGLPDGLIQPTEEQTNEQIFSISPAQYNGVSDQGFLQNAPERSTSQGRKNLGEALAAMRVTDKQNGAAEVYTRSLLWDQIPNEVVRNFAKMVSECNNVQNEQQQCNDAR